MTWQAWFFLGTTVTGFAFAWAAGRGWRRALIDWRKTIDGWEAFAREVKLYLSARDN